MQVDYDHDGLLDIFIVRGGWSFGFLQHPNSLLRNMGAGRFEDVTFAVGLYSPYSSHTAAWADFDGAAAIATPAFPESRVPVTPVQRHRVARHAFYSPYLALSIPTADTR